MENGERKGFWSVMGFWGGLPVATGWDIVGYAADAEDLLARALTAGLDKEFGEISLKRQADADVFEKMLEPDVPEGAFREVNLPPMPDFDA